MYTVGPSSPPPNSVLVVDDTATNRTLYGTLLRKAGFDVRCAASGAEALAALAADRPALMLLDYMMPGMDGAAVLRAVRSCEGTAQLPVVVLTASSTDENIALALDAGADDYMTKPIDSRILVKRLEAIIRASADRLKASERDLMKAELEEARRVQRAQLPRVPFLSPGWTATGAVVPSGRVGGDVFDLFTGPDGDWFATLIDVSGHGTASALIASELRSASRMLLVERSLPDALSALNQQLAQRDAGKYACIGVVHITGDRADICNTGLPPIVLQRRGRPIAAVAATGLPPGLFDDASYDVETLAIEPGDRIVMISDGLSEPFGAPDDVLGAVQRLALPAPGDWTTAELSSDGLEQRIRRVTSPVARELLDDATVLLLERAS